MSAVFILVCIATAVFFGWLVVAVREQTQRLDRDIPKILGGPRGARFRYQCTLCKRDAEVTVHDADEFIAMVHDQAPVCDDCPFDPTDAGADA